MLMLFAKSTSNYLTVCVAIERFIAVCRPLKAASICTNRNAYITVGCVLSCSFVSVIPLLFSYSLKYYYDPCVGRTRPKVTYSELYNHLVYQIFYYRGLAFLVVSLLPMIILILTTYNVLKSLKASRRKTDMATRGLDSRRRGANTATIRVLVVVIVFLLLETPKAVHDIAYILKELTSFGIDYVWTNPLYYISRFLTYFNSFVNFFIYCATGNRFRK
ncbi:FMRFamide receptor-like [Lineus longissimus]|uniref:FMRFamide receptor-like n=1 Tax=Lineus longissimus TaxID=88925 RepID=UPI00315CF543